MSRGQLYSAGAFAKLIFTAFFVISIFLISMLVGFLFAMPLFGVGFMELIDIFGNITHPDNLNVLKYFQIVQSAGLFLIPPFILGWLFGGNSFRYLKINKSVNLGTIILTSLIMISAIPVVNYLAEMNSQMTLPEYMSGIEEWMKRTEESAMLITEMFLRAENLSQLTLNLIMIAIIPAIGEELLFRGVIQRIFSEWTDSRHAGIWIGAILFSAFHMQFYGFIPRMLLGILFGYLLIWTGKMWVPVIAHFVNNALAVLVYFFIEKDKLGENIESFGLEQGERIYIILSLILFSFFLLIFYRREKTKSRSPGI